MKRSAFIIAALAAFTLSGCNMGGNSGYTVTRMYPFQKIELTDDKSEVTTYLWDETGKQTGETLVRNQVTVYESSDYKWESNTQGYPVSSFARKNYNDDGTSSDHRVVITFDFNGLETKYEVFEEGALLPFEVRETSRNSAGYIDGYKITLNEVVTLERRNYEYSDVGIGYSFEESVGGAMFVPMYYHAVYRDPRNDNSVVEYKIYADWTGSTSTSRLVEEQADYKSSDDGDKISYSVLKYDENGTETKTMVAIDCEPITTVYQ
jgi:hypothetical protein